MTMVDIAIKQQESCNLQFWKEATTDGSEIFLFTWYINSQSYLAISDKILDC